MWIAYALIGIVAALHVYFGVLEMFLWTRPATMASFGTTPEFAQASAVLAANQGLYNWFLAAGLIFALVRAKADYFPVFATFFLICVLIAGLYGGATASQKIFFVQALPAALALAALYFEV